MKSIFIILVIAALLWVALVGVTAFARELPMTEKKLEGEVAILLPKNLSIVEESPIEDFVIYTVKNSAGKIILRMYAGNHPDAINAPNIATNSKTQLGGFKSEFVRWTDKSGLRFGVVTINLLEVEGWPQWLQISYDSQSESEMKTSESIISSVHAYKKN